MAPPLTQSAPPGKEEQREETLLAQQRGRTEERPALSPGPEVTDSLRLQASRSSSRRLGGAACWRVGGRERREEERLTCGPSGILTVMANRRSRWCQIGKEK